MPISIFSVRLRLGLCFFLGFVLLLFLPLFLPSLRLTYFAPYLVVVCYYRPLFNALWHGAACGLLIDLFSSSTPFGVTSLTYVFSTAFLYSQTRHFFEDKSSTLPVMTSFFAVLSTGLQALLLGFFGCGTIFCWRWVTTDLVFMPLLDAAYAFLWFSLPFHLIRWSVKFIKTKSRVS